MRVVPPGFWDDAVDVAAVGLFEEGYELLLMHELASASVDRADPSHTHGGSRLRCVVRGSIAVLRGLLSLALFDILTRGHIVGVLHSIQLSDCLIMFKILYLTLGAFIMFDTAVFVVL